MFVTWATLGRYIILEDTKSVLENLDAIFINHLYLADAVPIQVSSSAKIATAIAILWVLCKETFEILQNAYLKKK